MHLFALLLLFCAAVCSSANDITNAIFGNTSFGSVPAAFGDFNSDKLTDIFIIRDDARSVSVLLANPNEPIMQMSNLTCRFSKGHITSVVPGDFDGDAMMDILVTTFNTNVTSVFILWGSQNNLQCPEDEEKPVLYTKDQPLVLDYNLDMIADLFGVNEEGKRMFWVFGTTRTAPLIIEMNETKLEERKLRYPHSHAFLDLDGNFVSDLVLTTNTGYEVWAGQEKGGFKYNSTINYPAGVDKESVGQNLFLDVYLNSHLGLVVPVCFGGVCENSTIFVHDGVTWKDLRPNFKDPQGNNWGFVKHVGGKFTDTITIRGGDFNLDGYPDLLVTLQFQKIIRTLILENVEGANGRTFAVQWTSLGSSNSTVAGAFFDFYQKGTLDVLLVHRLANGSTAMKAFKNGLDYDANFLKVMVLTGLGGPGPLPYGTNLPGPRVSYFTVTQDGSERYGCAAQLSQSAHFALQLPYSIFGLGRTPNFVDRMTTGYSNHTRDWLLVIPNSQMVIVPPLGDSQHWRMQLFVTPSRTILETMAVLLSTCVLNVLIIGGLHLKEKREDRLEKLQEAHRFHFDAM
ncbi:T-cell immunomodulatory protein-like [Neocloeon triangulifer]|uniref:T-cell immunomodulatory protein-like n=1 Tax=Neocloeon triangulifer TaxID=2078957 RepID=UPI00286ECF80|nr:T-cell immunomodulatory protein-like [Neocloeon triangulifer]XP_059475455.1 T-cell immunomodulatory protein-like [Neocloeon triangulifer]